MSLVGFQLVRHHVLITVECVVYEGNARNPVSMFWFTVTLEVVLSTGKVPHEVTPIHEITLVREEETKVLKLCWHLNTIHIVTCNASHPLLILGCMTLIIHTWEEHILLKYLRRLMPYEEIRVLFIL